MGNFSTEERKYVTSLGGENVACVVFFLPYKIERYGCYNDLQAVIFGRGCKTGAAVCTAQTYEQSINVKKNTKKTNIFLSLWWCLAVTLRSTGSWSSALVTLVSGLRFVAGGFFKVSQNKQP